MRLGLRIFIYAAIIFGAIGFTYFSSPEVANFINQQVDLDQFRSLASLYYEGKPEKCNTIIEQTNQLDADKKNKLGTQLLEKIKTEPNVLIVKIDPNYKSDNDVAVYGDATEHWNGCLLQALPLFQDLQDKIFPVLFELQLNQIKPMADEQHLRKALKAASENLVSRSYLIENLPKYNDDLKKQVQLLSYIFGYINPEQPVFIKAFAQLKSYEVIKSFIKVNFFVNKPEVDSLNVYLSDPTKPEAAKVFLLTELNQNGLISKIIKFKTAMVLKTDKSVEVQKLIQNFADKYIILNQEDLNLLIEMQNFKSFNFKSADIWAKVDALIKDIANLKNPQTLAAKLDYSGFAKPITFILESIAAATGYQSQTFTKLTQVLSESAMADLFVGYYEKLLLGKAEFKIAISYMSKLPLISDTVKDKIKISLKNLNEQDKLEALTQLTSESGYPPKTSFFKVRDFFEDYMQLLKSNKTDIANTAYQQIHAQALLVLDLLKEVLAKNNLNYDQRLQIRRLIYSQSSKKEDADNLEVALEKVSFCNAAFVSGLLEFSVKKTDTLNANPAVYAQGQGLSSGKRAVYYNDDPEIVVQNSPKKSIFAKFLKCEQVLIKINQIKAFIKAEPKFKNDVLAEAKKSKAEKKKFLLSSITN